MNSSNNDNNTKSSELVIEKPTKTGWYQILKTDPILLNVYKEYAKQKYLERKNAKPKPDNNKKAVKATTKSPEEKAKYRTNYYNQHKPELREYQREYYHRKIKGSARAATRKNKELSPEAKRRRLEYLKQYREKTKELLKFAKEAKAKQEAENNI